MIVGLWHNAVLLRLLFVFVLAAPLILVAVFFRGRGDPRQSERKTDSDGAPVVPAAVADAGPDRGSNPGVEASPREWRDDGWRPDRRVA